MSLSNPCCPYKFCEFCDTPEDIFIKYTKIEEKLNEGRVPGLIDESN